MNATTVFVLVITGAALGAIFYLEWQSRRNEGGKPSETSGVRRRPPADRRSGR